MKIGDLKKRAEAILKLEKLPRTIIHQKLKVTDTGLDWVPCREPWHLKLENAEGKYITHPSNTGKYRIAYVLEGPEGELQAVPLGIEEWDESFKTGFPCYSGGFYGDDISRLIDRLSDWIEE